MHSLLEITAQQSAEIALLLCRMILCWQTHDASKTYLGANLLLPIPLLGIISCQART